MLFRETGHIYLSIFSTFRESVFSLPTTSWFRSINYGAIGAVIGHEITHGFDDQGSQFDQAGNLHNWWSAQAYEKFNQRKQCMVEQYNSYVVPHTDLKVITLPNSTISNSTTNTNTRSSYQSLESHIAKFALNSSVDRISRLI